MAAARFSTALRNTRATATRDALDSGSGAGRFVFYTAPVPATGAAITTQTKLGTCVLSKPCGTISGGVLTFDAIADDQLADADGEAAFVRAETSEGTFVMDLDVTNMAGAGPVKMVSTTVIANGVLHFTAAVINEGNA